MTRFSSLQIVTILCFSVIVCSGDKSIDDMDNSVAVQFTILNGSNFVFHVNRRADHPDVQLPFEELQETDYITTNNGRQYRVNFSENIETIIIIPDSISGTLEKDTDELKQYALKEGLFAGGRFIVWIANNRFEAEYTIYGSGVPIIQSERGYLESANQYY